MSPLLQAQGLGLQRGKRRLLQALDFSLQAGEIWVMAGPNGAGKSSLLQLLCGAWEPSLGSVDLLGRPLQQWSAPARARQLAVLPQQSALNFPFTVREVLRLGRLPHATGWARDEAIVDELLARFEIENLAQRDYTRLSGGERQRVQLARVLAQVWPDGEPKVLLLDEPTTALDWSHQLDFLGSLRALSEQGLGILMVLHDLNLTLRYADRILLLNHGQLCGQGAVAEVLTAQTIKEVFGVSVTLQPHPQADRWVILA